MKNEPRNSHIKSFAVRGGRFSKSQQNAYGRLKDRYSIDGAAGGAKTAAASLDFPSIFGNSRSVVAEIGFGSGTATAEIAEGKRSVNFLCIEVYKPGIGNLLKLVEEKQLVNVRIFEGDAFPLFRDNIPPSSLRGVHLFFPDPWPKKRHRKRRLVRPDFSRFMLNCLEDYGYIYFVTDWEDYAEHAMGVFDGTPGLINKYGGCAPPQSWRPVTRFHRKGEAKDHGIYELYYLKQSAD